MVTSNCRDHVTFRTSPLEAEGPGEDFINPRCFGEDLANWLIVKLRAAGFDAEMPIQEDWGWGFRASKNECSFWINLGLLDNTSDEWLLWIKPEMNVLQKLFSKINPSSHKEICQSIDAILQEKSGIYKISWHQMSEDEGEDYSAHP